MATLEIKSAAETKWDCVSFGEVMLRFDPGFGRVRDSGQNLNSGWSEDASRHRAPCRERFPHRPL